MCEGGQTAWLGTETVERGVNCQGHRGIGARMGRKGQMCSCAHRSQRKCLGRAETLPSLGEPVWSVPQRRLPV